MKAKREGMREEKGMRERKKLAGLGSWGDLEEEELGGGECDQNILFKIILTKKQRNRKVEGSRLKVPCARKFVKYFLPKQICENGSSGPFPEQSHD